MDNDIGMIDKYIFLLKSRCNDDVIFVKCMANKVQITKYILGFWKYFRVAEKTYNMMCSEVHTLSCVYHLHSLIPMLVISRKNKSQMR